VAKSSGDGYGEPAQSQHAHFLNYPTLFSVISPSSSSSSFVLGRFFGLAGRSLKTADNEDDDDDEEEEGVPECFGQRPLNRGRHGKLSAWIRRARPPAGHGLQSGVKPDSLGPVHVMISEDGSFPSPE
jgi:hypothetical protein